MMAPKKDNKTSRIKIPKENIIRPQLQKEIGSRCPFCPSEDVSHFEIHHIDGNKNNHIYENLILLCRQCHSKFTKRVWELREGREKKDEILKITNFRLLESMPLGEFDYACFGMRQDNGRLPEQNPNGSIANVKVIDHFNIQIILKQTDGRIWKGDLSLKTRNYGELSFIYQNDNEIELGRRECYIIQNNTLEYREDKFYLKPLTDLHIYGDELFVRKTITNSNISISCISS